MPGKVTTSKGSLGMEFLKKTAEYISGGTLDYIRSATSTTSSIVQDAKNTVTEVSQALQVKQSEVIPKFNRMKNQGMMKSIMNWFVGKTDDYDSDAGGGSYDEYDDGTVGEDEGPSQISESKSNANQISGAITGSIHKSVEANMVMTTNVITAIEHQGSIIESGFKTTNDLLGQLIEIVAKNTATLIETTTGLARDDDEDDMNDMLSSGKFNLKTYLANIGKNIEHSPETGMGLSMLKMVGSVLKSGGNNPKQLVSMGMQLLADELLPNLRSGLEGIDEAISETIMTSLMRLGENKNGGIGGFLSRIFGIDPSKQEINTSRSELQLKSTPFDTLTKEYITGAIPGYLRKILVAVGGEDVIYDARSRSFRTNSQLRHEFMENATANVTGSINSASKNVRDKIGTEDFARMTYDLIMNDLGNRVGNDSNELSKKFTDPEFMKGYIMELIGGNNKTDKHNAKVMADRFAQLDSFADIRSMLSQASKNNANRKSRMNRYVKAADAYGVDLSFIEDNDGDEEEFIKSLYGRYPKKKESTSEVSRESGYDSDDVVLVTDDYTNKALYEIYRRLNFGINVFKVGENNTRKNPFKPLGDLPTPPGYRPKPNNDQPSEGSDNKERNENGDSGEKLEDKPNQLMNQTNTNGEEENLSATERASRWGKERGKQIGSVLLHGSPEELKSIIKDSVQDVSEVVADKARTGLSNLNDKAGNVTGYLAHKLTGKGYSYQEYDEKTGTMIETKIANNEKGGMLGFIKDKFNDSFDIAKKKSKGYIQEVLGYFDYGKDDRKGDEKATSKRKRLLSASAGAFAGAGLLGGPIGLIMGAVVGNALSTTDIGDKLKDKLFGRDDETGKPTGLLSKATDAVVLPVKYQIGKTLSHVGDKLKKNIFGPLSDIGFAVKERVTNAASTAFGKVFHKIAGGMASLGGKIAGGLVNLGGKAFGGVLGAKAGSFRAKVTAATGAAGFGMNRIADIIDPTGKVKGRREKRNAEIEEKSEKSKYSSQKAYKEDYYNNKEEQIKKSKEEGSDTSTLEQYTAEQVESTKEIETSSKDIVSNTGKAVDVLTEIKDRIIPATGEGFNDGAERMQTVVGGPEPTNGMPSLPNNMKVPDVTSGMASDDSDEKADESKDHDNEFANAATVAGVVVASSNDNFDNKESNTAKKMIDETSDRDSNKSKVSGQLKSLIDQNDDEKEEKDEKKESFFSKLLSGLSGGLSSILGLLGNLPGVALGIGALLLFLKDPKEILGRIGEAVSSIAGIFKDKQETDAATAGANAVTQTVLDAKVDNLLDWVLPGTSIYRSSDNGAGEHIVNQGMTRAKNEATLGMNLKQSILNGMTVGQQWANPNANGTFIQKLSNIKSKFTGSWKDKFKDWKKNRNAGKQLKNAAGDAAGDIVEDTVHDAAGDVIEDVAEESVDDAVETTVKESVQDSAEEAVKDSAEDATKTAAKEAAEDASQEVVENSAKEAAKDVAEDSVEDAATATAKEAAGDAAEDAMENPYAATAKGIGRNVAKVGAQYAISNLGGLALSTGAEALGFSEETADKIGQGGTALVSAAITINTGKSALKNKASWMDNAVDFIQFILDTFKEHVTKSETFKKFLNTKAISKIAEYGSKCKSAIKNAGEKFGEAIAGKISKGTGKSAASVLSGGTMIAVGAVAGLVSGACSVEHLFGVLPGDADFFMTAIASLLQGLWGALEWVPACSIFISVIDIIDGLLESVVGIGIRQQLVRWLYTGFGLDEEAVARYDEMKQKFSNAVSEYNTEYGTNLSDQDFNDFVNNDGLMTSIWNGKTKVNSDGKLVFDDAGGKRIGGLHSVFEVSKSHVTDEEGNIIKDENGDAIVARDKYGHAITGQAIDKNGDLKYDEEGNEIRQRRGLWDFTKDKAGDLGRFLFGGDLLQTDENGQAVIDPETGEVIVAGREKNAFEKISNIFTGEDNEEYYGTGGGATASALKNMKDISSSLTGGKTKISQLVNSVTGAVDETDEDDVIYDEDGNPIKVPSLDGGSGEEELKTDKFGDFVKNGFNKIMTTFTSPIDALVKGSEELEGGSTPWSDEGYESSEDWVRSKFSKLAQSVGAFVATAIASADPASIDGMGGAVSASMDADGSIYSGAAGPEEETTENGGNPLSKDFSISSPFGTSSGRPKPGQHLGVDLVPKDKSGEAMVQSRFTGKITEVKNNIPDNVRAIKEGDKWKFPHPKQDETGNMVTIVTDEGLTIKNMHLKHGSIPGKIRPGAEVKPGDLLGKMGSTGWSTANHLHYEMSSDGRPVDPTQSLTNPVKKKATTQEQTEENENASSVSGSTGTSAYGISSSSSYDSGTSTISNTQSSNKGVLGTLMEALRNIGSSFLAKLTGGLIGSTDSSSSDSSVSSTSGSGTAAYATSGGYGSSGSVAYLTGNSNSNWISIVREVKKQIASQNPIYWGDPGCRYHSVTINGKTLNNVRPDCSGIVCAMLKFYGVMEDNDNMNSSMMLAPGAIKKGFDMADWPGWESLVEGDIIVTDSHVEVFCKIDNGTHKVYNGGSTKSLCNPGATTSGHSSYKKIWRCKEEPVTSTVSDPSAIVGSNSEEVYKKLRSLGYSPAAASGVMGVWQEESHNDSKTVEGYYIKGYPGYDQIMSGPEAMNQYTEGFLFPAYARSGISLDKPAYYGDDGNLYPGIGLAQWTGPRHYRLKQHAEKLGKDWRDMDTQIEYMDVEKASRGVSDDFKGIESPEEAAEIFARNFEGTNRSDWIATRKGNARTFYDNYINSDVETSSQNGENQNQEGDPPGMGGPENTNASSIGSSNYVSRTYTEPANEDISASPVPNSFKLVRSGQETPSNDTPMIDTTEIVQLLSEVLTELRAINGNTGKSNSLLSTMGNSVNNSSVNSSPSSSINRKSRNAIGTIGKGVNAQSNNRMINSMIRP